MVSQRKYPLRSEPLFFYFVGLYLSHVYLISQSAYMQHSSFPLAVLVYIRIPPIVDARLRIAGLTSEWIPSQTSTKTDIFL